MTQSNVSRHLIKLKNCNIVEYYKKAQWIYYRIDSEFEKKHILLFKYLKDSLKELDICKKDLERLNDLQNQGFSCEKID